MGGRGGGTGGPGGVTIVAMANEKTELEVLAEKVAETVELLDQVSRQARRIGVPVGLALRQAAWLFLQRHGRTGQSPSGLPQAP